MRDYELALGAERDLLEVARYTLETWGPRQTDRYEAALLKHFEAIADGSAHTRRPLPLRPELYSSRCQHHYVFSLERRAECPLILAVLHESMDLIARLAQRLMDEGLGRKRSFE
ncbi:MAG: type II toxin-antitoxin system RelE/ParE family toxin [Planctomycetota bacterium]